MTQYIMIKWQPITAAVDTDVNVDTGKESQLKC